MRDDEDPQESAEPSPAEVLTLVGMQKGTLVTVRDGAERASDDETDPDAASAPPPPPKSDAV